MSRDNKKPDIRPCSEVHPAIYAFSTPGYAPHDGMLKIGYTERTVEARKHEIFHTGDIEAVTVLSRNARYEVDPETGAAPLFKDHELHAYLAAKGFERKSGTEWFRITESEAKQAIDDFRNRRAAIPEGEPEAYELRPEQARAVKETRDAYNAGVTDFLWNAKPRFGKTLATYDLMRSAGMDRILILTNRPAVADSWHGDYARFVGGKSGIAFVSGSDGIRKEKYVTRPGSIGSLDRFIAFASLQDVKGAAWAGGRYDKLDWIRDTDWDMLVIDESHEGADTEKADAALDAISRKFTLWLSGTPFKQIASGKFPSGCVFNWSYADEQGAKEKWSLDAELSNPYEDMPRLNLYTYRLSDMVYDMLSEGFDEAGHEWAFDLGEFFRTNGNGAFVHEAAVDKFLDALTSQPKFPFSPDFRDPDDPDKELRHTFWLLDRVESVRALARKLETHPVFGRYRIVVAAGDARKYDGDLSANDLENVREAITDTPWRSRSIILSVGKLTTGVTIPELTGIMMLCNIESPQLYMQTSFRAQNPCLFVDGSNMHRKTDAYVFDFDPARTLSMFGDFADGLCCGGAASDGAERRKRIDDLLNFFPVIGEDPGGEMVALDVDRVMAIPKEVYASRVVESGFMANCLFRNIGTVFAAPKEVLDMLGKLQSVEAPKKPGKRLLAGMSGVETDPDTGEVSPSEETQVGRYQALFGNKVYADAGTEKVQAAVSALAGMAGKPDVPVDTKSVKKELYDSFGKDMVGSMGADIKANLGKGELKDIGARSVGHIEKKAAAKVEETLSGTADEYFERHEGLVSARASGKLDEQAYQEKLAELRDETARKAQAAVAAMETEIKREMAREIETAVQKKKKATAEEAARDKLRGFSRTIPAFLMAYGTPDTTLANFDLIPPDGVFEEVTGITMDEFRLLRDGGDFPDPETGGTKHFDGGLFDEGVFDGSVQLFMKKRAELADWFEADHGEDIFDYIPPQRTNQIFTPRAVVKYMVDELGKANPGIFDDPDRTFIDLYMKSGMYVTELAKRIYASPVMESLYPDSMDRLKHIFEHQLYGLAPTEIIYRIAMNYIFGFDTGDAIDKSHFRMADAAKFAKDGTMEQELDRLFGGNGADG